MKYIFIIIFLVFLFGIIVLISFSKKKNLTKEKKQFFERNYKKINAGNDYKHKIIDFDKLYHKLLLDIGYKGDFGEILKLKPKEIDNLNKVWELHKLRNKLVHDFDLVEEVILLKKSKEYYIEFEKLLKKVS